MGDPGAPSAATRYTGGSYLEANPDWHVEDSAWKADQVERMLRTNGIEPRSLCDVGSGAGEVLRQLRERLGRETELVGYDVSPQAHELAAPRATDGLRFELGDLATEPEDVAFDVLIILDVIEHLEDPFGFLRSLKSRGGDVVLHIPLDMTVQAVARNLLITHAREPVGHIHYFQKETALATLTDSGYEIVDWFYTPASFVHPPQGLRERLIRGLRRAMFRVAPDFTVRWIGGWSLMVLAR